MDYSHNQQEMLDAIVHAVEERHIAVVETTLKGTGEPAHVLVAVVPDEEDGSQKIYPLALLFNQSPFELVNPPGDGVVERAPQSQTTKLQ